MALPIVMDSNKLNYFKTITLIFAYATVSFCTTSKNKFSTKTPYEWAHPNVESSYKDDDLNTLPELKGMACSATHTTVVARHGTRYPGLDDVEEITSVHEKLVSAMEPDSNPDLYHWKNRFPSNNNKALAHLGEDELEAFGMRVAKRLNTLFFDEDISNFRFITSSQERTKQSASAFFGGFINAIQAEEDDHDEFDSEVNDELMRFFDLCARYVYEVKDNETALKEYYSFMNKNHVQQIKEKIIKKLALDSTDLITTAHIRLIYLICGYEHAIYGQSPWCSLFEDEDMVPLEYLGDLKHYYKNGYGHNITWLQSCPLVSEIFSTMDEVILEIENTEEDEEIDGFIVGQFAFGHAETLGPLISALGLYNDSTPLTADNYQSQGGRSFRTSELLPFAANIMFVLYECVPEELSEEEEIEEAEYHIKVLVNEKPIILPGCSQVHCNYNEVRKRYQTLIDECNFKKLCRRPAPKDEL